MSIAIATLTLLFVAGAAFIVAGVHLLVGLAWAFIACGILLFGAGVYLRAGIRPNG
jgi:hypothetical protein